MEGAVGMVWRSLRVQNSRRWVVLAVGLVAVVTMASVSAVAAGIWRAPAAGPMAGGQAPAAGPRAGYGWQALQLTDEQVKQIDEIRRQAVTEAQGLQSQLLSKRQELASEYAKDVPDIARVQSLVKEIAALRGEISAIYAGANLRALAVLTDEQRARLRTFGRFGWGGMPHRGYGYGGGRWHHPGFRGGMMGPGWGL